MAPGLGAGPPRAPAEGLRQGSPLGGVALDPELRAYLEAMEQRAVARDAETRQRVDALTAKVDAVDAKVGATRAVAEAALQVAVQAREEAAAARQEAAAGRQEAAAGRQEAAAARQEAAAARQEAHEAFKAASREAGALNDKALAAIKTLGDGLAMHREAVERRAEDREQALMDAHIAPLEASAANHEERIVLLEATRIDHEERITAVEQRP